MSDEFGTAQTGTPTQVESGARMDVQGGVPTDFTARTGGGSMEETQQSGSMLSWGENIVRQEPWRAIAIGLMIGLLLGRRTRPQVDMVREEYVEPAVHRTQGLMFAGTLALGAILRSLRNSMAWRTREAIFAARCYSKPLTKATRKATRRAQRKLHIGRTSSFFWQ